MRLDNKFYASIPHTLGKFMKLLFGQSQPNMRHGDFVAIDRVEVVDAAIIVANPVTNDLVSVQTVVLPLLTRSTLGTTQNIAIKFLCRIERVDRERVVKRRTRCRLGEGYKLGTVIRRCAAVRCQPRREECEAGK